MAQLVYWLSLTTTQIDQRNIVDRTDLTGIYEFSLMYEVFPALARPDMADLFTAVQDRLGLKLESRKETQEVIVGDYLGAAFGELNNSGLECNAFPYCVAYLARQRRRGLKPLIQPLLSARLKACPDTTELLPPRLKSCPDTTELLLARLKVAP